MVMTTAVLGTKNNRAAEDPQQLTQPAAVVMKSSML
jgi:hypothetical protein